MNRFIALSFLSLLATPLLLSGCSVTGAATGAAATVGVAASQEGGISQAASDARIQIEINDLWFRHDVEMFRKLDMTVSQGRVLLTGIVQNPEHRVEAVRLAWQPRGVSQVINEITVAESSGIAGFARDAWITARLRTSLTLDRNVLSINYNIDTVQGVIYLMGFAQSQVELNHVIELARTVPDVKRVVSYVQVIGDDEVATQPEEATSSSETYVDDYSYNDPIDQPVPTEAGLNQQDYVQPVDVPQGTGESAGEPIVITGPDTTKEGVEAETLLWQ